MKKSLIGLLLGAAIAATSATAAPIFSLTNVPTGWDGEMEIKFTNFESFSAGIAVGSQNFGIIKVTSIIDPTSGNTLWADGQNGGEITGVFNGITVKSVVVQDATHTLVDSTGGVLNLYLNPTGSLAASGSGTNLGFAQGLGGYTTGGCGVGALCYGGITGVAGGGSFFNAAWTPGVNTGDPTATVSGTFTSATLPATGTAQGYLNVTGGPYMGHFDTNGFPVGGGNADLFAQNDFCTPGQSGCVSLAAAGGAPTAGGWQLRSNDPVRANFIPEPDALALVGLAFIAIAAIRRRKA